MNAPAQLNSSQAGKTADHQLVDRIIYLASLASNARAIEALLDTLRRVTSRWSPDQPLTPEDTAALTELEAQLKDYLVRLDPLRAFTTETLAYRLKTQFSERKWVLGELIIVLVLAILAAGLAFFGTSHAVDAQVRLAITLTAFLMALTVGTGWFYLTSLRYFKSEVRGIFVALCLSIFFFAAGFSSFIAVQAFGLGHRPPFAYGASNWFVDIAFICTYIGLRRYGKLLQLKGHYLSWQYLTVAAAIASVIFIFVPHPPARSELGFDFSSVGLMLCILLAYFAARTAYAIVHTVTAVYAKPIRWFFYYIIFGGLISITTLATLLAQGELSSASQNPLNILPAVIPQLLLLYSSYVFKKEAN